MADVKPSDVTLEQRIINAYNLMQAARRNGETQAEQAYMVLRRRWRPSWCRVSATSHYGNTGS